MKHPLNLELSSYCNQKCYFCPQYKYQMRNRIMPMKLFQFIIDTLYDMKISIMRIVLSGMGDPLTDNNLCEKIRYSKKICNDVVIFTNAALLTEEKMKELNGIITKIYFSIHGGTPEAYEKYSENKFEKIKEIAIMGWKIFGKKLIISNYPTGELSKYLGLAIGSTHPIHNWGDEEIARKTGSKMDGCKFCYSLNDFHIKIRVDGSISTCGNDWNHKNDLLNKKFPACKNCYSYEYFMKLLKDKKFEDYILLMNKLQKEIWRRYNG